MAGNVSEWCRNKLPPGYASRGGSWKDAIYAFGQTAGFPGFYSEPTLGFRCVKGGSGDEGDFAISPSGFVPSYTPVDDATFEEYRKLYAYAPEPLNARVIEVVEGPYWTREKVTFTARGKTVPAYLFLPKGFQRPLQVIHFAPAGDVVGGWRTLPQSVERNLAGILRGGRAVFAVELEGFLGRPLPHGWVSPDSTTAEYVDYVVERVTEMRRGLDYLESRNDIDRSRIGFLGVSAGGGPGVFVTALESRYRSVAFAGTGIHRFELPRAPAANRVNFVSRISAPKLMLHGRFDEDCSLKSEAEPMYKLLREPKRLQVFDGGHVAPFDVSIPVYTRWFDETMGPVEQ
jgi:dienelactone hydrolase